MSEEWAIRDEATGEWWTGETWSSDSLPWRYASYPIAMNSGLKQMQAYSAGIPDSVRIVPAPPREMTDVEAEQWLRERPCEESWIIRVNRGSAGNWYCGRGRDDKAGAIKIYNNPHGYGASVFDAIRAARKKLEGR